MRAAPRSELVGSPEIAWPECEQIGRAVLSCREYSILRATCTDLYLGVGTISEPLFHHHVHLYLHVPHALADALDQRRLHRPSRLETQRQNSTAGTSVLICAYLQTDAIIRTRTTNAVAMAPSAAKASAI